jgi:hypothetical protein
MENIRQFIKERYDVISTTFNNNERLSIVANNVEYLYKDLIRKNNYIKNFVFIYLASSNSASRGISILARLISSIFNFSFPI